MTVAILAEGVRREFNGTEVLRGVDIEVGWGKIATLLGPNGAGKTTLIRILTTELMPHGGIAQVAGFDVVKEPERVREKIAVVPQEARPMSFLTPWEFVYSYLLLRGASIRDAKKWARESLEELGLWQLRNRQIHYLSGGMKRRVLVAAALASHADVIFLDEPTVGLDVAARRVVWDALFRYRDTGASIFLTTHYIEEAEYISDKVFLMNKGKVIAEGSPRQLVESLPGKYVIELPSGEGIGCIRINNRCLAFVDSLTEINGRGLKATQKSLEHFVLLKVDTWEGEDNE